MHAKQPISSMQRLLVVQVVGNLETSRRIGVKVQHFNTPSRPAITSSTAPTVSPSKPSMSCALLYKLQVRATTCKQWMPRGSEARQGQESTSISGSVSNCQATPAWGDRAMPWHYQSSSTVGLTGVGRGKEMVTMTVKGARIGLVHGIIGVI